MKERKSYRVVMGQKLREFRESRGLTAYRVAKNGGIRIDQVASVEAGETNYTIDVFLGYVIGCDLYLYFGEKGEGRKLPHDFEDLAEKAITNDPDAKE